MSAVFAAELAGGFLICLIISRLARRVFFNKAFGLKRLLAPSGVALAVVALIAGFTGADGGSPQFVAAIASYLPAVLLVVAFDVVSMRIATWREDRLVDLKETEEAVEWADEMIRAQDGRVLAIQDEALDLAVRGVREAESAGTLAPDPRPDAEIRESIREMWEADMEREREEEERGD